MLHGPLTPDPLEENVARLDAIKIRLRGLDDDLPFLLFPVRIETRFVRTERSAPTSTETTGLMEQLEKVAAPLGELASRDLGAPQGREKKAVHTFVKGRLEALDALLMELHGTLDDFAKADVDQVRRITLRVRGLQALSKKVGANLQTLESEYMRMALGQRWEDFERQRLTPLLEALSKRVIPRLKLRAQLTTVPAAEVQAELKASRELLAELNQRTPTGPWRERRPRPGVSAAESKRVLAHLHRVADKLAHAIEADTAERRGLAEGWSAVDTELTAWMTRLDEGAVREEVAALHDSLSALDAKHRVRRRVVRTKDMSRSAAAYAELLTESRRLVQVLRRPEGRTRFEQAMSALAELRGAAEKMTALARQLVAIPEKSQELLTIALRQTRTLAEAWLETLARGRVNRPTEATELRAVAERTRRVLHGFEASIDALSATGRAVKRTAPIVFLSPTPTVTRPELWVRIFPDDILVESHERALTESEVEHGRQFWRDFVAAAGDDNQQRAAWATLCAHHSPHRAAWIARRLKLAVDENATPSADAKAAADAGSAIAHVSTMVSELAARQPLKLAWAARWAGRATATLHQATESLRKAKQISTLQAKLAGGQLRVLHAQIGRERERLVIPGERRERKELASAFEELFEEHAACTEALAALPRRREGTIGEEVLPEMPLPQTDLKDGAWTQAAQARLLPKRFVVVAVRGGNAVHVVAGNDVSPRLTVGIGPAEEDDSESSFSLDENGDLTVDARLRWLTDYNEAVRQGMAVTVPLTEQDAARGFDRLFVVGVRETSAHADRQALEALFEGHRYTPKGLELLPLGTPTNNTESEASGHSQAKNQDAMARYELEFGETQFSVADEAAADDTSQADGFRLATALGIDASAFERVGNAGGRQISDAILINRLLWPATMGHYLEEMLAPVVSVSAVRHVERFFTSDVLARGPQPSIRVGTQPYAVLPTMAFRAYRADRRWKFPPPTRKEAHADAVMAETLRRMAEDWLEFAKKRVKRAGNWDGANAKQHFMDMMAVHPTASELHWRFAMNSAPRVPLTDEVKKDGATSALLQVTYRNLLERFHFVLDHAYSALEHPPGTALNKVQRWGLISQWARTAAAYDVRYLSDQAPVFGATKPNSLSLSVHDLGAIIDSLAATAPGTLVAQTHDGTSPMSLLGILLRHSVLCAYREAAMDVWELDGLLLSEERLASGTPAMFSVPALGAKGQSYLTKWSFLLCTPAELATLVGNGFATGSALTAQLGSRTLASELAGFAGVTSLDASRFAPALERLAVYQQQLLRLKQVGDVDRLFREHLDLCSYRLDAWRTALATRRLRQQRARSAARGLQKPGVYVGAYGWVEDLRPDAETPAFATAIPEGLVHLGEEPVYTDPRNEGLIYAPSINHATTAAVLRSAYLSSADQPDLDSERAVNLSSRRVRVARWLLTGIRNGNSLGGLLGYRFERGLHEAYDTATGVELDVYIFKLRREFPTAAAVDPQASTVEDRERQVVDGLALLDRVRAHVQTSAATPTLFDAMSAGSFAGFPWGLESDDGALLIPPKAQTAALTALVQEVDAIADALDALGDLLLAEGVYQVARGNLERAAAVTSAMAEGRAPPDPQVVDTPRTGTRVTQRVVVVTRPIDGNKLSRVEVPDGATRSANRDAAMPAGWKTRALTPRASLEPTLNAWLASFLGSSETMGAFLVDSRDASAPVVQVKLKDIGLQPIDFVMLLGGSLQKGLTRLQERVMVWARKTGAVTPAELPHWRVVVSERHASWASGTAVRSFHEMAMLCEALYKLLTTARTTTAADLDLPEHRRDAGVAAASQPDTTELKTRITEGWSQLEDFAASVARLCGGALDRAQAELDGLGASVTTFLKDSVQVLAERDDIEAVILQAWDLGLDASLPTVALESAALHTALATQLRAVYRSAVERLGSVERALTVATTLDSLRECARELFGGQAPVVVRFPWANLAAVKAQLKAPGATSLTRALGPDALDDWLHAASKVRERISSFEQARMLSEAFDQPLAALRPAQLPYAEGDYWLGATFPMGYQPTGDKLSIVLADDPALLDDADDVRAGLVVDEWNETLPAPAETTGVTFHYDAPDAAPPQCLLLVVSPVESGKWYWEDLVHALDETLDLAMVRMVEPDHLQDAFYGHLLPALTGEVLTDEVTNHDGDRPSLNLALAQATGAEA